MYKSVWKLDPFLYTIIIRMHLNINFNSIQFNSVLYIIPSLEKEGSQDLIFYKSSCSTLDHFNGLLCMDSKLEHRTVK